MSGYQQDKLRDHEYDGIQEYDNKLPNWWLFILYACCIFAVGYWLVFHTFGVADLPLAEYDKAVTAQAEAELAKLTAMGLDDDVFYQLAGAPSRTEAGHTVFVAKCVTCHGADAEGLVGPNLTDRYWIHGGSPMAMHKIVMEGVPDKGMVAWRDQLTTNQILNVVAYMLTIKNTEVPGKAPQGDLEAEPVTEEVSP